MSQGNFCFLEECKPTVVANYLKRLLRELKDPLIPFNKYEEYYQILCNAASEKEHDELLKEIINDLDPLRYNTLKYLVNFFRKVVSYKELNRMTSYNVAVTVAPNIFRSKEDKASDILNHKVFYEAMIRMIDNYEYIFDEELDILD